MQVKRVKRENQAIFPIQLYSEEISLIIETKRNATIQAINGL